MIAKPKDKGLVVPRIREVPDRAMVAWVMDIMGGKKATLLFTSVSFVDAIVSYLPH